MKKIEELSNALVQLVGWHTIKKECHSCTFEQFFPSTPPFSWPFSARALYNFGLARSHPGIDWLGGSILRNIWKLGRGYEQLAFSHPWPDCWVKYKNERICVSRLLYSFLQECSQVNRRRVWTMNTPVGEETLNVTLLYCFYCQWSKIKSCVIMWRLVVWWSENEKVLILFSLAQMYNSNWSVTR